MHWVSMLLASGNVNRKTTYGQARQVAQLIEEGAVGFVDAGRPFPGVLATRGPKTQQ
jgi:hypothetical protein